MAVFALLAIHGVQLGFHKAYAWTLNMFLAPIVGLAILSVLLAPMLGEKWAKLLTDAWIGFFRLVFKSVGAVINFLVGLLRK